MGLLLAGKVFLLVVEKQSASKLVEGRKPSKNASAHCVRTLIWGTWAKPLLNGQLWWWAQKPWIIPGDRESGGVSTGMRSEKTLRWWFSLSFWFLNLQKSFHWCSWDGKCWKKKKKLKCFVILKEKILWKLMTSFLKSQDKIEEKKKKHELSLIKTYY